MGVRPFFWAWVNDITENFIEFEGTLEASIAAALKKDLRNSLMLGLQTVRLFFVKIIYEYLNAIPGYRSFSEIHSERLVDIIIINSRFYSRPWNIFGISTIILYLQDYK